MKKLLSILLALVLALSLAAPAFASADPDAGFDDYYTDWAKMAWEATCKEQPERTAQFLKELPDWFDQEFAHYFYDSFDEYAQERGGAENVYLELFEIWNWGYEQEQARNEFITAHGGVPGQINVMVNGRYVKFTDAVPQITGGRTMVPFRAVMDALGGESEYDGTAKTVTCTMGDAVLTLVIGSDTMTVAKDGKTASVKMDCAPYISGEGRTYVPVRFISEALGFDVQWDSEYRTAVITDLDALAAQIDRDFTIYNKLMEKNALTDKAQRSVGSAKAEVTLFDTLDGDKKGKGSFSYDLTASLAGTSGEIAYDFSALWEMVKGYIPMPLDEAGAEEYAQSMALMGSLMKGGAQVRMDLEKGWLYFSMPALFEALGGYLAESGVQLPKDGWLSLSLEDMDLDELTGMMGNATTMGSSLCALGAATSSGYSYGYGAVSYYDDILEAAGICAKLVGDAKFVRKGNANVLTLTRDDVFALLESDGATVDDADREMLSQFNYTVTVKDNGDVDVDCRCNMALSDSGMDLGAGALQVTLKGSNRGGKSKSTMELHMKNVLKMTVSFEQTVTETSAAPELAPPKGTLVLPIDGTLPSGAITSPDGPIQLQP